MSRHNLRPTRAALAAKAELAELVVGVGVDVDYLPPVNPARPRLSPGEQVMIPVQLWDAVRADARAQRDLARGESELFRARSTSAATAGDRAVQQWEARNPGLAQLLDHPTGGA